ncbi:MAG: nodulation protein NfeD [Bacteroidetes bacterium]|nr:nodulation protein NfeD [Bacteroidota bacterium]
MRKKLLIITAASVVFYFSFKSVSAQTVYLLKIDGTINPATAEYIERGLTTAQEKGVKCIVIQLNTPGGLLKSTRAIVTSILESDIPIVVYVAPGGAHAGSAGVFITMAAHIAAMAPGTNIGAAHPVGLQGQADSIMNEKATNDAAAFIRAIAEKRKRNLSWAEDAVRKSLSISDKEALEKNVIDIIATNVQDLLQQIDGREVETSKGIVRLSTKDASLIVDEMAWSEKILDIISDPNIAYILFLLGIYGLIFELYNPGAIVPGVIGVISLILAFYSMHTLPINYAGLALIIVGIILFLLEIKIVSHGLLSIGGILCLFLGSIMLIRTPSGLEIMQISWTVIVFSVILTTLFFLVLVTLGLKAQKRKPTTGEEGLIGEIGEALENLTPHGMVRVHGELWKAVSTLGKIPKGTLVRISRVENLTLYVEPLQRKET